MSRLYRIQPTRYDRRTGIIDPIGRSYAKPSDVEALTSCGHVVVAPVTGWGQYTHLIATPGEDGDEPGAPYFLARFVEDPPVRP
jgi:hypothetical protein